MAEYYAVERSLEYLMHYGVKGMRWGVRKARQLGLNTGRGAERLTRNARKAAIKLQKLKSKADIIRQAQEYKGYKEGAKLGLGVAGLGAGIGGIAYGTGNFSKVAGPLSAVVGSGLGTATASGIHALVRRNRLSSKGHAKAVQKVRDWQNSMNESFKGTRYAKLAGKRYQDKYVLDKSVVNPITGRVTVQRLASISGEDLTRDHVGPRRVHIAKPRHISVQKQKLNSGATAIRIGTNRHGIAISNRAITKADAKELRKKRK